MVHILDNVSKYVYMLEEIYSKDHNMANDGTLAKVLFCDIIRQVRLTPGQSSVDTANSYDSIAYAIVSLVFQ